MTVGTERRGTAVLAKNGLALSNIRRFPFGGGMSAKVRDMLIVNIYSHSGAEKRQEREAFYNTEVVHLIPSSSMAMILAGDFNCVLTNDDFTRRRNYSRGLARLIQ